MRRLPRAGQSRQRTAAAAGTRRVRGWESSGRGLRTRGAAHRASGRLAATIPSGIGERHRRGRRENDERHVLGHQVAQLGGVRLPEGEQPHPLVPPASSSLRTRASLDCETGVGGVPRDERALVEHADPIAEREGFAHVVRHDHDRFLHPGLDRPELGAQLRARDRIERAEGLVHQQHRRVRGQRARDANTLPLAAGELVGPSVAELRRAASRRARAVSLRVRDALVGPCQQSAERSRRSRPR